VYRTASPVPEKTKRPGFVESPLGLARVVHRVFQGGDRLIDDEFSVRHFADLTRGYGVQYREDVLHRGPGNTFTGMAQDLHRALAPGAVDLALVAHSTPDLDCRLSAATFLSEALPNGPLVFALSDSGTCTPFAALRLAGDFARRHGYRSALVLVLDQATLPYDVDQALAGDAGVALLLDDDASSRPMTVAHEAGVREADLPGALDAGLGSLIGPDEPVTVIAGAGVDAALIRHTGPVLAAGPGFPCTSAWALLSAHGNGRAVLVEYDRTTGDLGLCSVGEPS
jgi:hypothetical protein